MVEHASSDPTAQTWAEIERVIERAAVLAREADSESRFYPSLLSSAVEVLGARGGVAWLADGSEGWRPQHCVGIERQQLDQLRAEEEFGTAIRGQAPYGWRSQLVADGEATRIVAPVRVQQQSVALLDVVFARDLSPQTRDGYARLLGVLAEMCGDFHRNRLFHDWQRRAEGAQDYDDFTATVHSEIDLERSAHAIANAAARFVGCGRVSIVARQRGRWQVIAISGVDWVDRRANLVQSLWQLSRRAIETGLPIEYPGGEWAPQIAADLDAYVDQAHSQLLSVTPLRASPGPPSTTVGAAPTVLPVVAVVVAEDFEQVEWTAEQRQRLAHVERQAALALVNASRFERLPLRGLGTAWQRLFPGWGSSPPRRRWLLALILIAVMVGVGLIPVPLRVAARGHLQPRDRFHLFAPADGEVRDIDLVHGAAVQQGAELLTIHSAELRLQLEQTRGELENVTQRLEGLQGLRISPGDGQPAGGDQTHRMAADEEQLKIQRDGLLEQQRILERRVAMLRVVAPIDGIVMTFDVADRLSGRPVRIGQRLLTVADPSGPWELRLSVRDNESRHVMAAARDRQTPLQVQFRIASDVTQTYRTSLDDIAKSVETDPSGNGVVRLTSLWSPPGSADLRPGVGVTARVDCGRRPLGLVMFRQLYDTLWRHLFF